MFRERLIADGIGFPRLPGGATAPLGWPAPDTVVRDVSRETALQEAPADPGSVATPGGAATDQESVDAPVAGPSQESEPQGASDVAVPDSALSDDVSRDTPAVEPAGQGEDMRAVLIASLPDCDDESPLASAVVGDARRRITLVGRSLPRPARTRVLTVANQKGGVGKTTTAVNVAAALAQAGAHVLVVDLDPQGNASTALGIDHRAETPSIYDVLVEGVPISSVVQSCPDVGGLLCVPATIDLAGAEIELVSLVARETRLTKAITAYLDHQRDAGDPIDYVFVDCPPSLGLLTVNAFVAAHEVFIPIQCEYYALEGLSQLLKNIELIRTHLNPDLHVSSILLTMFDGRTRLAAQVADEVREHFPGQTFASVIPRSVRISEAPSHGQTVMTYDPNSSGALSYLEAAAEMATRGVARDEHDEHNEHDEHDEHDEQEQQ